MPPIDPAEVALCRKLLVTLHLNVPERRALPGGRARLSALVEAARGVLDAEGWLPPDLRPDDVFTGVLLEARPDGVWVHERHEVGVGRFSEVQSMRAVGLAEAVAARLRAEADPGPLGRGGVDGVPIDYRT